MSTGPCVSRVSTKSLIRVSPCDGRARHRGVARDTTPRPSRCPRARRVARATPIYFVSPTVRARDERRVARRRRKRRAMDDAHAATRCALTRMRRRRRGTRDAGRATRATRDGTTTEDWRLIFYAERSSLRFERRGVPVRDVRRARARGERGARARGYRGAITNRGDCANERRRLGATRRRRDGLTIGTRLGAVGRGETREDHGG